MYELARARAGGRFVVMDEGPLLIAYHLFVYSSADLSVAPIEDFASMAPVPDRVVYVRSPLPLLVERTFTRPDRHRQLARLTREEAQAPLRRALDVFDRLVSTPPLAERTLVVENDASGPHELRELVRRLAGALQSPTVPARSAIAPTPSAAVG
jgi:hypothetical protein